MLEYGQPLHAFDINAVARVDNKHAVIVRTPTQKDVFTTLDGENRMLNETNLLIADPEKPIGIAGVMGGENSRITEDTSIILFESANFDAANIRKTARGLGMRTDASARYEKGLDPNLAIISANRAMELIEELGAGKVVPGMVDVYPTPRESYTVPFNPNKIKQLLGLDHLSANDICAFLKRIGIETTAAFGEGSAPGYMAVIPTHRADITAEADLAEEVGRFYGLNNIPSRYVQWHDGGDNISKESPENPGSMGTPTPTPSRKLANIMKQATTAVGYYEAKSFPFESPKVFDRLLLPDDHPDRVALTIKNPLGEDMSIMRTLPLSGLLESLGRNYSNSNESAYLFELAKTYHPKALPLTELPYEPYFLTLAAYGPDMDFLTMKGDVEEILASLNILGASFGRHQLPYTHPGKTALIQCKDAPIGYLAELHPRVCENYEIGREAYIAVLCVEAMTDLAVDRRNFTVPSVFPAMDRDIALVVPGAVTSAEVEAAIRERGSGILTEVKLFDVYQGPQIEDGHKSMAYNLRFRAKDRTLTDKDAQKAMRGIVDNLQRKLGAKVRDN